MVFSSEEVSEEGAAIVGELATAVSHTKFIMLRPPTDMVPQRVDTVHRQMDTVHHQMDTVHLLMDMAHGGEGRWRFPLSPGFSTI